MDNLVVVKHNKLIEAGYRLNIYESRILLSCIAQIDSMGSVDVNKTFTVNAKDLMGLTGINTNSRYKHLRRAANTLYERSVTMELDEGGYVKTRWVSTIWFRKNDSTIEIKFAQIIIPFLTQLRRDFTRYGLENVLKFTSSWSIRVYELIVKWGGTEKEVDLDWLKTQFQLEDKYNRVNDLRNRVLDVAVKDINEHSDMKVGYEQVKRGRRVTGFIFRYELKNKSKKPSKKELENKARPGESYEQVKTRLRQTR